MRGSFVTHFLCISICSLKSKFMKKISTFTDAQGNLWQKTEEGKSIEMLLLGKIEEPKKTKKVKKIEEEDTEEAE